MQGHASSHLRRKWALAVALSVLALASPSARAVTCEMGFADPESFWSQPRLASIVLAKSMAMSQPEQLPMVESYVEIDRKNVKYLRPDEAAEFEVQVKFGRLVNTRGQLLDDMMTKDVTIFVLSPPDSAHPHGRLYVWQEDIGRSTIGETGPFSPNQILIQHSSFLASAHVSAAGTFRIEAGRIAVVTNRSGHYFPAARSLLRLFQFLRASGYSPEPSLQIGLFYSAALPGKLDDFVRITLSELEAAGRTASH